MTTIYECDCGRTVDLEESLLVRQAKIRQGHGTIPGEEPRDCLACVTDEPPIWFVRKEFAV